MTDSRDQKVNDHPIDARHEDLDSQLPLLPDNPRELVSNPAVAPQMPENAPEDLRGDLFKDKDRE